MTWLNLLPFEMQPGDIWGADDLIIESIEPVESPSHCRIIFANGDDKVWPLEAPMRIYRDDTPSPHWEDVKPKEKFL